MADKDREKWNNKYHSKPDLLSPRPASRFVIKYYDDCGGKQALDLACGSGRNALFLCEEGFFVDAVDISSIALASISRKKCDNINLIETDLDDYTPKKKYYDFIIMTNFLDRDLIERSKIGLKVGGIFIIETYMVDEKNEKKDSNSDFLLKAKELQTLFKDEFEILSYDEFWNETYEKYRMKKQAIVAKKIY